MIVHYESRREEAVLLVWYASMRWKPTPLADDLIACRRYPMRLTWLQRALQSIRNI